MRLLNARNLGLETFIGDYPSYAILSHCWGDGEVLFSDLLDLTQARRKQGFSKVEKTCEQAVKDGFDYVWIDTCCIDKSSSAELSEAINSMFAWYRNSDKCYAYLSDVDGLGEFAHSKWFTRAWTLQELLAPSHLRNGGESGMDFFSNHWVKLGSKSDLSGMIRDICGIEKEYLEGQSIYSASISMRMSWAAERQATRAEDIAYSLLGIFDVNMPLLYGEGKLKAFRRLQEEIMKISEDETLFAWESGDFQTSSTSADVLASDPKDFSEARHLVPFASDELPTTPHAPIKYATYLSLGCQNGPALQMPRAWCYIDDTVIPVKDIDLLAFHNIAGAKKPRREVDRYRRSLQDMDFGIKVSIEESRVLGQRMFIVDIEYIKGENKLGIPTTPTNNAVSRPWDAPAPAMDRNPPSFTPVDVPAK